MNDYERENLVAWGQAAAGYAIIRNNDSVATGIIEDAFAQGIIEGEHTRYIVTRNTGDVRLGNRAGRQAQVRTTAMWLGVFGLPFALFLVGVGLHVAMGSPTTGAGAWFGPLWLVLCFVLLCYMGARAVRLANSYQYVRANLPDERTLNKSGYYEVEPNVWFNMITNRVLEGACYRPAEDAERRAAWRNEERAIRDMYRNRGEYRGSFQPTGLRSWYVDKMTQNALNHGDDDA